MPTTRSLSIPALRAAIAGRVIAPTDDGYDAARAVFVGGIDRHPAVIVQAATVEDVQHVVRLAGSTGLPLAIRSGGHSNGGLGVVDDGIVLDLRDMRALDIDAAGHTAWVQPGLTAGEYSKTVTERNLVTGFGDTGSVGIGGITLGGGVGYLVRKYGLTIDDLLAADIVTADGELLRVDANQHPDLFWAIRVEAVTSASRPGSSSGCTTCRRSWVGCSSCPPPRQRSRASSRPPRWARTSSTIANVMPCPPMPFVPAEHHGQLVIMGMLAFAGPPAEGEAAVAPFRALASPLADMVKAQPYTALYPPEDDSYHPMASVHTCFIDSVDTAVATTIMEHLEASTAMMRVAQLRVLGGAMARVPTDATAFAHRGRRIMVNVAALYQDAGDAATHEAWATGFADALSHGDLAGMSTSWASRVRPGYARHTRGRPGTG